MSKSFLKNRFIDIINKLKKIRPQSRKVGEPMSQKGSIIEIYHFINPLASICYDSEKIISDFACERYEKVSIRFIPFINFSIIKNQIERDSNDYTLNDLNELYTNSYHSALAFYAASMQGKKYGRQFLMGLQHAVIENKLPVALPTFKQIVSEIKIDPEMFLEDYHSSWVKQQFIADQKLTQEMEVKMTPSCVVYTSNDNGVGYLIESSISKDELHKICKYENATQYSKSNLIQLLPDNNIKQN